MKKIFLLIIFIIPTVVFAQSIKWASDGNSYYRTESGEINRYVLPANIKSTVVSKADLTPPGQPKSINVRSYSFSEDKTKLLIYTNTRKVWRQDTRGDYWVLINRLVK